MKMGLLKSVTNVPDIDYYEYRDNQYYNKYLYRLRFKIPCARYIWWCKDPDDIDLKLNGSAKFGMVHKRDRPDVVEHLAGLKSLVSIYLNRKKSNFTMRVEGTTVAVFSNDLASLQNVAQAMGSKYTFDYTEVQTSEYAGVKHFVGDPKHKYRVYMKSKRVSDEFPKEMTELFKRTPSLHPSPAFDSWLKARNHWKWRYSSASHFIDYDDESTLSYLALMHGEMLGKKYKLEKRPDIV